MSTQPETRGKGMHRLPPKASASSPTAAISPTGWTRVPLGSVATIQLGKMLSAKARRGENPRPYLRNINVRWHRVDVSDVLEMDFDAREIAKYTLLPGDVLVCEGGEPGRAAIWTNQLPGALFQKALHRVRAHEGTLDPRLLVYQLELDAATGQLQQQFTGSTISHLPREAFLGYQVRIPPLAEQPRLLARIEERLSDVDGAVRSLARVRANARRLRHAVLEHALERAAGAGAERKALAALASSAVYGTSEKCSYEFAGPPVLRIPNIAAGRVTLDDLKFAADAETLGDSSRVAAGDLLVVRTNGSRDLIGRGAVVMTSPGQPLHFASYLIRYRLQSEPWLWEWISAIWHSRTVRREMEARAASSAGQYNLSIGKLDTVPLLVPPKEVAERLVGEIRARTHAAERLESELTLQLARAARLREAILQEAFAPGSAIDDAMHPHSTPGTFDAGLDAEGGQRQSSRVRDRARTRETHSDHSTTGAAT